jgi:hypothetical protein
MPESAPNPVQTLAVLLGASSFRRAPKLAQGRAFYNSAEDFREYLLAPDGLSLPGDNVISLFNESDSPSKQLDDISEFLDRRSKELKSSVTPAQDLIVYYVGHGLFSGADRAYCLAISATNERNEGPTSIRVSDLASIIKDHARFLRKFLILDCCFSSRAHREFQTGPLQAGRTKLLNELPQRGTTLLCSASAQDPSLAPEGLSRTMFSDGLLRALRQGHSSLGPRLSLSELGDLVKVTLKEAYPETWVRPEVHSPDQREGNIADVHLFPNAALAAGAKKLEEQQHMAEAAKGEITEGLRTLQKETDKAPREGEIASPQKEKESEGGLQQQSEEKKRSVGANSARRLESSPRPPPFSKLIGANTGMLRIVGHEVGTSIALTPIFPLLVTRPDGTTDQFLLTFENVRGLGDAFVFSVHVTVLGKVRYVENSEQFAGALSMSGVREATGSYEHEPGPGLHFTLDITRFFDAFFNTGAKSAIELRVRLVSLEPVPDAARMFVGRVGVHKTSKKTGKEWPKTRRAEKVGILWLAIFKIELLYHSLPPWALIVIAASVIAGIVIASSVLTGIPTAFFIH